MTEAVIVSTARTPLCKSWRGAFNMTHGATLGAHAVRHAVSRAGIDSAEVEDVIMGCANPEGATGGNIARQIALRAGLSVTTAGITVNRFCSSGLQSIAMASQRIMAGEGGIYAAGGVESISCVQNELNKHMARANGGDRRQALRHFAGAPGRVRRAQPAESRCRAGGGQVRRRDRAHESRHGHRGQGDRAHDDEGSHRLRR